MEQVYVVKPRSRFIQYYFVQYASCNLYFFDNYSRYLIKLLRLTMIARLWT